MKCQTTYFLTCRQCYHKKWNFWRTLFVFIPEQHHRIRLNISWEILHWYWYIYKKCYFLVLFIIMNKNKNKNIKKSDTLERILKNSKLFFLFYHWNWMRYFFLEGTYVKIVLCYNIFRWVKNILFCREDVLMV